MNSEVILSITVIVGSIAAYIVARKKVPHLLVDLRKGHLVLILAVEVLGLILGKYDSYRFAAEKLETVERPEPGEDTSSSKLISYSREAKSEIEIKIAPRKPTVRESKKWIAKARKEIDESVLGKNRSVDQVYRNLNLREAYSDGLVKAAWDIGNPELIDISGKVYPERVKNPTSVLVSGKLSCGDIESIYDISVRLIPPPKDTAYGFSFYLRQALREANHRDPDKRIVKLPKSVSGSEITWSRPGEHRGAKLSGLGILIGLAIIAGGRQDRRKRKRNRMDALSRDYPMIVGSLSLYVSAGIGIRGAFERIAGDNAEKIMDEEHHPGYAAVRRLLRQLDDGSGEQRAYEDFGRHLDHRDYGKLSLLLTQNLKKGSRKLAEKLEKEEAQAFEHRKIRARVAGEEASTKLLIPMGMLLAVVLAVMVMPSVVNMQL